MACNDPGRVLLHDPGPAGWSIVKAHPQSDIYAEPGLGLMLDDRGAARLTELTTANVGSAMAVVIDGEVYSAPVIKAPVTRRAIITGRFTSREVWDLAARLESGPARFRIGPRPPHVTWQDARDPPGADTKRALLWTIAAAVAVALVAAAWALATARLRLFSLSSCLLVGALQAGWYALEAGNPFLAGVSRRPSVLNGIVLVLLFAIWRFSRLRRRDRTAPAPYGTGTPHA